MTGASSSKTARLPQRYRRRIVYVCLALLLWEVIAWTGARLLITQTEMSRADALLVLSGSAAYEERVQLAAQLFSNGWSRRIILTNDQVGSGWSTTEQRNPLFVERARDALLKAGVPAANIEILPAAVAGTYDEAIATKAYAESHKLHSVLVVTSPYHSRRALWTFRRVFNDGTVSIGLVTVPTGIQSPSPATWWLSIRGWRVVAGEYLKGLYYRLRYG